jgi:hypothetical protein
MKSIINGLRYDTKTAVLVGEADNIGHGADSTRDFQYWEAGLYKTPRSGRFFLAGEGGPMSMFRQTVSQNSWSGSSRIIPMSRTDALAWAEQHLDPSAIETYFADDIQDA